MTLEGLAFELDPAGPDVRVAAVSAEDTELTIRDCLFRQSAVRSDRNRAAIRLRVRHSSSVGGDRPPMVFADSCHFDGGQVGIVAEGPADILLRDCTMGPGSPFFWIDNSNSASPVPADIHLRHSSLMVGAGPVFELQGALARISVDDCVIAPAGNSLPTLVAIDSPRNLTWRGRSNLYARMRAYLQTTRKGEGAETIDDFARWKETSSEVREVDTVPAVTSVWKSAQPLQELIIEQETPTQAFQLAAQFLKMSSFGARQGPYKARLADPERVAGRQGDEWFRHDGNKLRASGKHDVRPVLGGCTDGGSQEYRRFGNGGNNSGSAGGERMPDPMPVDGGDDEEDDKLAQHAADEQAPGVGDCSSSRQCGGVRAGPHPRRQIASGPGSTRLGEATNRPAQATAQVQHSGSTEDLIHNAEQFTATLVGSMPRGNAQDRSRRRSRIACDRVCGIDTVVDRGRDRVPDGPGFGFALLPSRSGRQRPGRLSSIFDPAPCGFKALTCSSPTRS